MTDFAQPGQEVGQRRPSLSRFDRIVLGVMALLLGGVILTVLLGDRVGVTLERVSPLGSARSTSRISLTFSENMNRDTVTPRLRVLQVEAAALAAEGEPPAEAIIAPVDGTITWNGKTALFTPAAALLPGAHYMTFLEAGAVAESGRALLAAYRFGFSVRSPRVAYLALATRVPLNLWLADPARPGEAQQLTFNPSRILDFGVSPDGAYIAYSERSSNTGTANIYLLELETGAVTPLTNCEDADCTTPVWRPDGRVIAYERVDFNSDMPTIGASAARIWLIDLTTTPATTRPLFNDSQILGSGLQWSRDGSRVTLYDLNSQGILLHDFTDNTTALIPSRYGGAGWLSPDGRRVVFPEITLAEGQARAYLQVADMEAGTITPLSYPDDPFDDDAAAWSPDGSYLVVARRYLDDRFTVGRQLFRVDPDTGAAEPLVQDARYANGFFSFDPTGSQLVIQRFPQFTPEGEVNNQGTPEIWTYDLRTGALTLIAIDAFHARWVP